MRIERLYIDRFGILENQEMRELSPGLNIIVGHNEAGKSTCLRFFRSMLFGYKRKNRSLDPMSAPKGTNGGGSLFLRLDEGDPGAAAGLLTLTRRPGVKGGLVTLSGQDGEVLDEGALQRLLKGLTVDVYDQIFAFSLKNLMEFSSLTGDSVRHALHGAAFGTGLHSPGKVLQVLKERKSLLLKARAGKAAINEAWRELESVREELIARTPDMELYTALRQQQDALEQRLDALGKEREQLGRQLGEVRRRKEVWRQWEEMRAVRAELAALGAEAVGEEEPEYAPDAVQRLDALLALEEERLCALSEAEQALAQLTRDMEELGDPAGLALLQPAVQTLLEQKRQRRDEAERLSALALECSQLEELQRETLARLGPDWDEERAVTADASLPARERLQEAAARLSEGEAILAQAEKERERLAGELAEAEGQALSAQGAVKRCALPDTPLPDKKIADALAADAARAEGALAGLPALRARQRHAAQEFRNALAAIDQDWTPGALEAFDPSLRTRQAMDEHIGALEKNAVVRDESGRTLRLAGEQAREASLAAAAASERMLLYKDLPDSAGLEARFAALRQMERLGIELAAARRAYDAANEAVSNHVAPLRGMRTRTWGELMQSPLIISGGLLFLSASGLAAYGLYEKIPDLVYAGAGLGLCALFAWALGGKRNACVPDAQALADEIALCRARSAVDERKKHFAASLAGASRKAASWLAATDPDEPGEGDLLRARRLLESQSRQLVLRERDAEELAVLERAAAREELALAEAQKAYDAAEENWRQARAAWREFMRSLFLPEEMRPETAAGIFDRVSAARAAASGAAEADRALGAALSQINACLQRACGIPFFAAALDGESLQAARCAAGDGDACDDALRAGVDSVRKALRDLSALEERLRERQGLELVRQEREGAMQRLAAKLAEADAHAAAARARLADERVCWSECLQAIGLSPSLSPRGAAEALESLAAFAARNKELAARKQTRLHMLEGLRDFLDATRELAAKAAVPPPPLPEGDCPDGGDKAERPLTPALLHADMALLDDLAARIAVAARNAALLEEKKEQSGLRSQALAKSRTALEKTRADAALLLARANARDAEAFRAGFAKHTRIAALRERERVLLAALDALAVEQGVSGERLLDTLSGTSRESLLEEEGRLVAGLSHAEAESGSLAEERGRLKERENSLMEGAGEAPLRRRKEELKQELHVLSRQWSVLALAEELLLRAKHRFEEEGQMGVIRHAGDIFAAITGGEYAGLSASLEDSAYAALHASGARLDPEKELSRGTREQLYLALRLAYISNHAAKARSIPVIMDDILVNFDPGRAEKTAQVLADFTAGHQMLFFTCHPGLGDMLLQTARQRAGAGYCPEPAGYRISKGAIGPWALEL